MNRAQSGDAVAQAGMWALRRRATRVLLALLGGLTACQTDCDTFTAGDCRSDQECHERSELFERGQGAELQACVDGRCRECRMDRDCPGGRGCRDFECEPVEDGVAGLCHSDASCQVGYACVPAPAEVIEEIAGAGTSYVGLCTAFGAECPEEGACNGAGFVCHSGRWRPECGESYACAVGRVCNGRGTCAPDFGPEQICFGDLDCQHQFPDGIAEVHDPDVPLTCVGGGCVDCPTDTCYWAFRTEASMTTFRGTVQDIPGYCVEEGSCDGSGQHCDLHQWRRDCTACSCP